MRFQPHCCTTCCNDRKNDKSQWREAQQQTFETLNIELTNAPILYLLNLVRPLSLNVMHLV